MKKIFITIFIISSSIFSFSAKPMQNKKLDVELKTMIHGGYDPHENLGTIFLEVEASKKFDVKKINTIFNVGGGIDFSNYFDDEHYIGVIRPYFATEIGGYVSPDLRMYTGVKLGIGPKFVSAAGSTFIPKLNAVLGITYKEKFTSEIGYHLPATITLGVGARFGF